jgi:DNA gyrase subunit A
VKFFRLGDNVKVIAAIGTDPRFTPADWESVKDQPAGPQLMIATSAGFVLRLPFSMFRQESTKVGRRYAKLDAGDKVVMTRLVNDEDGTILASKQGYIIHFPIDQVNVLSGVGKGVIGIKLDAGDVCLGGELLTSGKRKDAVKFLVETESERMDEYTYDRPKTQNRGGKGEKLGGVRTKLNRVVPAPIVLANWDDVGEAKPEKPKNGLFE